MPQRQGLDVIPACVTSVQCCLLPLTPIPHSPLPCITAGLTLQAATPKLLGLRASAWGQPQGGPSERLAGWAKEKPGVSSSHSAVSSVSRCSGFSSSHQVGPLWFQLPLHDSEPHDPSSSFHPSRLRAYSNFLLLLNSGLPCHPPFEFSAFSSPCDQIRLEFHVCYTLRVVLWAGCTLMDTPIPYKEPGTEWAPDKCLWSNSGCQRDPMNRRMVSLSSVLFCSHVS